jgi:hypothetical protein
MKKHEQTFLTELRNGFKPIGGFWFKIPDSPTNMQIAKPYDVYYILRGVCVGLEAKYYSSKQVPPADTVVGLLRPSQIDGLSLNYACGGVSVVVVQTDAVTAHWYKAMVDKRGFYMYYLDKSTRVVKTWTVPNKLLALVEETRNKNVCRYNDVVVDSINELYDDL